VSRIIVGVVGLALLLAFCGFVQASQTLTIPDDFPTIQAAIDAARPGDTVRIRTGRYGEALIVNKPLTLVGEGRAETVIQAPDARQDVITTTIESGTVVIQTLAVKGGHVGVWSELGEQATLEVLGVVAIENKVGIIARGAGRVHVYRSFFVDNQDANAWLENATTKIEGSEFLRGGTGMVLGGSTTAALSQNVIALGQWAIDLHTRDCGYSDAPIEFACTVTGTRNRVYGIHTDLCPPPPLGPWPEGFLEQGWAEAVTEAAEAFTRAADLYSKEQLLQALTALEEGLRALDTAPFPFLEAELSNNVGVVCRNLGRYEQALAAYRAARQVYAARVMEVEVADNDANVGIVYAVLGRYEEALAAFQAARQVYVARGMEGEVADVDTTIGSVYSLAGRHEEALTAYQAARRVYVAHAMEVEIARVDKNVGVLYDDLGRYEEALVAFQAAREVFALRAMVASVAGVDNELGVVYFELGQYSEALAAYRAARDVFVSSDMETDVATVDMNLGTAYDELGQYSEALAAYRAAREVYVAHGMETFVAKVDMNLGVVYTNLGMYDEALAVYQAAREVHIAHGMEGKAAKVDMNVGGVHRLLGRYEEGLAAYAKALATLDRIPPLEGMPFSLPAERWVLLFGRGLCLEGLGLWNDAAFSYRDSIAVVESMRNFLRTEGVKLAWAEQTKHVYERLVDLLYWLGRGDQALSYSERCRARTFLDALYQSGLSSERLVSVEAGISAGAVAAEEIEAAVTRSVGALYPNEALFEYFVTERGVYLWVVTKDGVGDPLLLKYPREQLAKDVLAGRQALEDPGEKVAASQFLSRFYKRLVGPGIALLPVGVNTLVFVPSGPLWYVPFAALRMPPAEEEWGGSRFPYLVEQYALAYLPSLASFSVLMHPRQTPTMPFFGLANPTLPQNGSGQASRCAQVRQYPDLEDATRAFAMCYAGGTGDLYVGGEAKEPLAYEKAGGREVVVYACHGQFNPHVPLESRLLLSPGTEPRSTLSGDLRVSDGNYHAWEALLTDHRGTGLVVLAACETLLPSFRNLQGTLAELAAEECERVEISQLQLEAITSGDEVVGLARAFLTSGARAVLGTLWQAQAKAVGELLEAACTEHKGGLSWAQALQKAQIRLLLGDFPAPWYWAPYQLVGTWR